MLITRRAITIGAMAIGALCQTGYAAADTSMPEPVIVTTRPSFTDSWLAIPEGSVQVELGASDTALGHAVGGWTLPESLFKIGLRHQTELRVAPPSITGKNMQLSDFQLGLSHHQALPKQIDLAVIPLLNIPTGANAVSSNGLDPQLRIVAAKTLDSVVTSI